MTDRARDGVALGNGVAVVVVVAALLPIALLARERFFVGEAGAVVAPVAGPVAVPVAAPVGVDGAPAAAASVDRAAVVRAADDLDRALGEAAAAQEALAKQAVDGERGERLRLLGRAVARAREVRRAAGQSGAQLRGPFPVAELDVAFAGFGPDRWLLTRDGAVVVPAGVTPPVDLSTKGRDEDVAVVDVSDGSLASGGKVVRLVRRCVAAEAYCIVDVDRGVAVPPLPTTQALRAALATTPTPPTTPPTTTAPTKTPAPTTPPATTPERTAAALVLLAIALSTLCLVLAVSRLRLIAGSVVGAALRLRTGLAGRSQVAPPPLSAEFAALDRAIDDAFAALAGRGDSADSDDRRRARWNAVANALDDARAHGDVARVDADAADDAVTARVVASTNALLDALDERARRWRALVADALAGVGGADVSAALAQRLLRLARLPGLPQNLVDELNSLGGAVADPKQKQALQRLADEVSRVTPSGRSASDRLENVAALRDLPTDDVVRLTAESPSEPPRPSE